MSEGQEAGLTIDRFRLRYRAYIFAGVRAAVESLTDDPESFAERYVEQLGGELEAPQRARLVALILGDLGGLHEGNIFRYGITQAAYQRWLEVALERR